MKHFQVVSMDTKGYILRFLNFGWPDVDRLADYLKKEITDGDVNRVEITRWNEKGERE